MWMTFVTREPLPAYFASGSGSETIFLLHGAYGSKEYWRFERAVLEAAGYRVIAWDAPGYGESPIVADYTIPHLASLLSDLIEDAGSERNHVLGHSMGGLIAQQAYSQRPELFSTLILSATTNSYNHSGPEWQERFLRERVAPITQGRSIADYAPGLLKSMLGPDAEGPAIDLILENVRPMKSETFQAAIEAIKGFDRPDILAAATIPVLCIAGELDDTCPAAVMARMAKIAPRGEYHEMKGVAHYGWAERPEEYNAVLLDFLARAASSA